MHSDPRAALGALHQLDRRYRLLAHASAVLQWDQETFMPEDAVQERADQLAELEGIAHERAVDPKIGEHLDSLGSTADNPGGDETLPSVDRDFLKVMRRDYELKTKLPSELVQSMARDASVSQAEWVKARKANDFSLFAPHLEKMIGYSRRCAECWGYADRPYDGLLNQYEPGMTEKEIAAVFDPLRARLSSLVERISRAGEPDVSFLALEYPVVDQDSFARAAMTALGFQPTRGRLDRSAHPFTTSLGDDDVRITTRYFPTNLLSGFFSVVHETGHALYELGFASEIRGTRLADGASMGIHESQSRLWENVIGRSRSFWRGLFPALRDKFPTQLADVDSERFYRAVNRVQPSLIRVDADEVTYSLHVILRFNLERRLMAGTLSIDELPEAWNREMQATLGVVPDRDADGVLQDVHWAMGAIGYFPSYALGNLYGLQFWDALRKDLPDIDDRIGSGDVAPVLSWLRERIHAYGRRYEPAELLAKVTGQPLSAEPFMGYLESKYGDLYSL